MNKKQHFHLLFLYLILEYGKLLDVAIFVQIQNKTLELKVAWPSSYLGVDDF